VDNFTLCIRLGVSCGIEPISELIGRQLTARITDTGFSLSTVQAMDEMNRQQAQKTGI
jgi:hypothetical protein